MPVTKEEIGQAPVQVEEVSTPEWGGDGKAYVRRLGGRELFAGQTLIEAFQEHKITAGLFVARMCALFLCDTMGVRTKLFPLTFNEDGTEVWPDVSILLDGPVEPMQACVEKGLALNGMTAKAHRGLVKNSQKARRRKPG